MSSFDDPSSFLFGLNQFPTPPQDNQHFASSSAPTPNPNAAGTGHANNTAASTPANIRLDPFAGALGGDSNDVLDGAGFADQLALWTNANFSFDGPTGHALLGDEDKEKEEAAKKDEEEKRAGKRPRNNIDDGDRPDENPLGGLGGSSNNNNGKARQRDPTSSLPNLHEPTHQLHKEQAALQQQQHYFAPPTSRADEGRRPGYSNAAMPTPSSERGSQSERVQDHLHQQQQQQPSHLQGVPAFNAQPFATSPFPGQPAQQQQQAPQLDLTSILALQQLISHNPLALAGLTGLSPGLNLQSLQGLLQSQQGVPQQQLPQQQQQQQQPFAAGGQAPQFWPSFNPQLTSPPFGAVNQSQSSSAAGPSAHADDDEVNERELANSKAQSANRKKPSLGKAAAAASRREEERQDSPSSSDGGDKRNSMSDSSASARAKREEAAHQADKAVMREEIPPLQLIDTGNPEADAEANRVAIEEDKRRRNTAASARFRVKKKQREAALEAHTKELTDQVEALQREMEKLRNENTWLKGLIQVRPAQDAASTPTVSSPSALPQQPAPGVGGGNNMQQQQAAFNALHQMQVQLQAAAAAAAAHQQQSPSSKSSYGPFVNRQRDTGVRPRGVGTEPSASSPFGNSFEAAGSKRDRED